MGSFLGDIFSEIREQDRRNVCEGKIFLLQFSYRAKLPSLLKGLSLNSVLLQFCNIILYNFVKSKRFVMTTVSSPWQRWEFLKVNTTLFTILETLWTNTDAIQTKQQQQRHLGSKVENFLIPMGSTNLSLISRHHNWRRV